MMEKHNTIKCMTICRDLKYSCKSKGSTHNMSDFEREVMFLMVDLGYIYIYNEDGKPPVIKFWSDE